MKNRNFKYKYAISARNSMNDLYYFTESRHFGSQMRNNSFSLTKLFNNKKSAIAEMEVAKNLNRGLIDWKIEYRKVAIESPITKITINS